ncbi:MAG: 6,7-dimethyl-8-ribityllumazine synthase [Planctomycetota bacterium]
MARDTNELDPEDGSATLPSGARIAAVVSTYHSELVDAMAASARRTLEERGLASGDWFEVRAPGAYELPLLAQRLAKRGDFDAILCFGLVLRGGTDHDRYISNAVSTRLLDVSLEHDVPVMFGVLTPNDLGQARRRARTLADGGLDKGREVALAAIGAIRGLGSIEAERERRKKKGGRGSDGR